MKALKRYLERQKITQVEFARRISIRTGEPCSQANISAWLSGRHRPVLATLEAIADETGLSIDRLLDRLPRPKSPGQRNATP